MAGMQRRIFLCIKCLAGLARQRDRVLCVSLMDAAVRSIVFGYTSFAERDSRRSGTTMDSRSSGQEAHASSVLARGPLGDMRHTLDDARAALVDDLRREIAIERRMFARGQRAGAVE